MTPTTQLMCLLGWQQVSWQIDRKLASTTRSPSLCSQRNNWPGRCVITCLCNSWKFQFVNGVMQHTEWLIPHMHLTHSVSPLRVAHVGCRWHTWGVGGTRGVQVAHVGCGWHTWGGHETTVQFCWWWWWWLSDHGTGGQTSDFCLFFFFD